MEAEKNFLSQITSPGHSCATLILLQQSSNRILSNCSAREVNIVPGITNSLLSTSKLADDDTLQYLIRTKWKSLMQLTRKSSQLVVQSSEDSGAQSPVYIVYHLCQQMK